MDRLKVGVVGVGIGQTHLRAYQKLTDEVEVVALCDVNRARLEQVADQFDVSGRYTSYEALFASGEIEAVSICLPNNLHAPVAVAALEAGLHVLCEKPLAENAASGRKIIEAAAKSTGKFMVCFNRRYRPDVLWMKKMIDEGHLGRIYQAKTGWTRETGIPGWTAWFLNKQAAGGGPLIDLGVHMLEATLWLLDYPAAQTISGDVQSNFGPQLKKTWFRPDITGQTHPFTVEDSATAFIRLANDISLNLEVSWASHARPGQDDFFITLMGTKGALELYVANYATENTLTFYTELGGKAVTIHPRIPSSDSDHFYAIVEFIKCIKEDLSPSASAADGLMIMEIIDAIYRSAELKREVVMD